MSQARCYTQSLNVQDAFLGCVHVRMFKIHIHSGVIPADRAVSLIWLESIAVLNTMKLCLHHMALLRSQSRHQVWHQMSGAVEAVWMVWLYKHHINATASMAQPHQTKQSSSTKILGPDSMHNAITPAPWVCPGHIDVRVCTGKCLTLCWKTTKYSRKSVMNIVSSFTFN